MSDSRAFLRAYLRAPSRVGAIAPSSPALAAEMIRCAEVPIGAPVIEIGAGTGPFTRAITSMCPGSPVLALEPDADLAQRAAAAAPSARVEVAVAQDLPRLMADWGHASVDRVVSGLPFASFPPALQDAILDAVVDALGPSGRMVTFTYVFSPWLPKGRRARAALERRFSSVRASRVVWRNLPPAFVYICDR